MIEVIITQEQIDKADIKAIELGTLNNSITEGEGNFVGFLGEIIAADYFSGIIDNTYDYDVIINNKKVDVKTKKTTVVPRPEYFASVAAYNIKQKCDSYYFVRIDVKNRLGYLLGGLSKKAFFENAIFYKKGVLDPTSDQGWLFKADCYNIAISRLKNPKYEENTSKHLG